MTTGSVGLTLGKFAPLHLAHQHVIETALSQTEHVIVVIYDCPEVISTGSDSQFRAARCAKTRTGGRV